MTKEMIQEISFAMIAGIGEAKYIALDAFRNFKEHRDKEKTLVELKKAEKILGKAGQRHLEIIAEESKGNDIPFSLIFMHAEDQYLTTQAMIEMLVLLVESNECTKKN